MYPLAVGRLERISSKNNHHLPGPGNGRDWYRMGSHGDGSCFFHSLAAGLNYKQFHEHSPNAQVAIGRNLRREMQRSITDEAWGAFWDSHGLINDVPTASEARFQLGDYKVWANLYVIIWTMITLKANCIFYDFSDKGNPYCGVTADAKFRKTKSPRGEQSKLPDLHWCVILIAWIGRSHFEPMCLVRDVTEADDIIEIQKSRDKDIVFKFCGSKATDLLNVYEKSGCKNVKLQEIAKSNSGNAIRSGTKVKKRK